jgi:cytochrome d ubiquinol oxidase subunit I
MKIFAVSFGMGVVSGIVMSFQFGTNWSRFTDAAANVVGPLIAYEVVTAFFLEASFLGIMLFGWERVGNGLHFLATCLVAIGTLLSTFWIIAANSWMQTPAGFDLRDGVFFPVDWTAVIFSPSFLYRFSHMVLAAYLTTAFTVAGIAAWFLWQQRAVVEARRMFGMALGLIIVFAPLQIVAGDLSGLQVLHTQPAKLAAIEAHWETASGIPLVLFAWPDERAETNRYAVEVPRLGSLVLTHDLNGTVRGLKEWKPEDRPPVAIVFWTFRLMAGLGFLMLGIGIAGLVLRLTGRLYDSRWFLVATMLMTPSGFVSVLAGWVTAEVGRQPYVVYDLLRTADAVSPTVLRGQVGLSLGVFVVVYAIVFGAGTYYILRLIAHGPETPPPTRGVPGKTPMRQLGYPDEGFNRSE